MATRSSILAWKIPWTEEPGGPQSMGSQRVMYSCACQEAGLKKILLQFMSRNGLPTFYYKSFIVFSLIFRSLIHFEFIFVWGVRVCSSCPVFSTSLIEETVSSTLCIFASLVRD